MRLTVFLILLGLALQPALSAPARLPEPELDSAKRFIPAEPASDVASEITARDSLLNSKMASILARSFYHAAALSEERSLESDIKPRQYSYSCTGSGCD